MPSSILKKIPSYAQDCQESRRIILTKIVFFWVTIPAYVSSVCHLQKLFQSAFCAYYSIISVIFLDQNCVPSVVICARYPNLHLRIPENISDQDCYDPSLSVICVLSIKLFKSALCAYYNNTSVKLSVRNSDLSVVICARYTNLEG